MALGADPPAKRRVRWLRAHRIVASKYPPIALFERATPDPRTWEALIALEQLTNPRIRDAAGHIALVAPNERVQGPGASWVMAPFTHVNPAGSRFSDGSFGVYYAGREFDTALKETIYHFERYARDSNDGPRYEDFRVLVGRIDTSLHDIDALPADQRQAVLHPDDYRAGRRLGKALRDQGAGGVVFASVRHRGGACVGIFKPRLVTIPLQSKHIRYHYDGNAVQRYFDYQREAWVDMDSIG